MLKERHDHDYTQIKLFRITKITNSLYGGSAGDKAFLYRACQCGKGKAFEYGNYAAMKQLLKELTEAYHGEKSAHGNTAPTPARSTAGHGKGQKTAKRPLT